MQQCVAALEAGVELLQDPALLRGQPEAIKRLGSFTDDGGSPFWPAVDFLKGAAEPPELPLAR